MKKILSILCVFLISTFFTACEKKGEIKQKRISVTMAINSNTINDGSYNESAWSGVKNYARKTDLPGENYSYVSVKEGDYSAALERAVGKKTDLVVVVGYVWHNALQKVSKKYPKEKFLTIDAPVSKASNVKSAIFAANEGSFLVGVAAGLKAQDIGSNKVGVILGLDIPLMQSFEAGYEAGVKAVSPNISVVSASVGDFGSPDKGKMVASKMYDEGVKIIFNVAGASGEGIIKEAKSRAKRSEDVWVVGVDEDQYEEGIYHTGKSVVLTSMIKRVNVPVFDTLRDAEKGNFVGGIRLYGLKENAVGLPDSNPNLKPDWLKTINKFKEAIESKKIDIPLKPSRLG